ncbi:hypothetical protein BH23ACT4_BH23ACT4_06990 [soil metagenome]
MTPAALEQLREWLSGEPVTVRGDIGIPDSYLARHLEMRSDASVDLLLPPFDDMKPDESFIVAGPVEWLSHLDLPISDSPARWWLDPSDETGSHDPWFLLDLRNTRAVPASLIRETMSVLERRRTDAFTRTSHSFEHITDGIEKLLAAYSEKESAREELSLARDTLRQSQADWARLRAALIGDEESSPVNSRFEDWISETTRLGDLTNQLNDNLPLREKVGELEWRVVVAEARFARLQTRKAVRVLDVLSGWAGRPWRLRWLLRGLAAARVKVPVPEVPLERPIEPVSDGLVQPLAVRGVRSLPYPGLRIAHAGPLASFQSVAPLLAVDDHDWKRGLEVGYDMLLVEAGMDASELPEGLARSFQEQRIPLVVAARAEHHLDSDMARSADLIVTYDPQISKASSGLDAPVLELWSSIDDTVHNPIGWVRQPANQLMVISDQHNAGPELEKLETVADHVHTFGRSITGLTPAQHHPRRPVGTDLSFTAKQYSAAYISPHLALSISAQLQLALELTASGTPVIAVPSLPLEEVLGGHYLPARTPNELQARLQQLADVSHRERISVAARRHVLTNHTHRHNFERILTELEIPTNPPDRVSILLATNRPDHLDHALNNVTRQDWPTKELLLILHGQDRFDLNRITHTLEDLPYPVRMVPCPKTWTLGDCLNAGLDQATGTHITKMDDDDHYGPHHLTDLHTALTYSNANITGKWANVVYLERRDLSLHWKVEKEESFGTHLPGATMFGVRDLVMRYRFGRVNRGVDSELWSRLRRSGAKLYSTHRFGFIRVRHGNHTYRSDDTKFIASSKGEICRGLDISTLEV